MALQLLQTNAEFFKLLSRVISKESPVTFAEKLSCSIDDAKTLLCYVVASQVVGGSSEFSDFEHELIEKLRDTEDGNFVLIMASPDDQQVISTFPMDCDTDTQALSGDVFLTVASFLAESRYLKDRYGHVIASTNEK